MENKEEKYSLIAPTAIEQLRRWDAGDGIWSIEMGGLGPGYEQAIQLLAIEIMRDEIDKPLPEDKFDKWGESAIKRTSHNGYSGAQVGAAKQIAYKFIKLGPAEALKEVSQDRHIQVSNSFPTA